MPTKPYKPKAPKFANEAESAMLGRAQGNGGREPDASHARWNRSTTGQGARESKNITIRIPVADIERARKLSARKGLRYQTLIKMRCMNRWKEKRSGARARPRHESGASALDSCSSPLCRMVPLSRKNCCLTRRMRNTFHAMPTWVQCWHFPTARLRAPAA
jgi:hypothetical protein